MDCASGWPSNRQGFTHPEVNAEYAIFEDGGSDFVADLPQEARNFIQAYEAGLEVKPFSFEVTLKPEKPFLA